MAVGSSLSCGGSAAVDRHKASAGQQPAAKAVYSAVAATLSLPTPSPQAGELTEKPLTAFTVGNDPADNPQRASSIGP